jgi:LysR family nod box-dependent transcriptional activator
MCGTMSLSQMDLNLLVALDALLREKNVTKAGEAVGLSQPAMSSALARLRRLFGDELMVRVGRDYHLTPLGLELRGRISEILHLIEETVEHRPEFNPRTDARRFKIAASDYATFLVLQPLLERVFLDAPGVSFEILPLPGIDQLMTGDVDLGIWPAEVPNSEAFSSQVLFYDKWACAVWSGLPDVGDTLTMEKYLSLPQLSYGPSSTAETAFNKMALERRVEMTMQSFFLLPFMLQGTHLVTLMHERLGKKMAEVADIRLLEPPFTTPVVSESMHWHPSRTSDPGHTWLREQLTAVASEL